MEHKKKLIEVALPLEAINKESVREKSIRHGHPSTLHLWWARRPLAAARAVIWASLVDDPSSNPHRFPSKKEQEKERERLFAILERLIKWENSNNETVLNEAKAEIMNSTNGNPPPLLDPFAGGGAIPLEAQRLGLKAYASDLNPVAVMINKAMIEIPPRFAGLPPVNPKAKGLVDEQWVGARGLAEDVRYYGEWMREKAFERIGHLYPTVTDEHGQERTVIAWIWARTVECPNPACGCEMPLVRSWQLSKRKGNEAYVQPIIDGTDIGYEVKCGRAAPKGSVSRRGAKCICCGVAVSFPYIRTEAQNNRMHEVMIAIVGEGIRRRVYYSPNICHIYAAQCPTPRNTPETELPDKALGFRVQAYGMTLHRELFTNRQLTALTTFSSLVQEAQVKATADAIAIGMPDDSIPLAEGGAGARAYGEAVGVYLAFVLDKMADYNSSLCSWNSSGEKMRNVFGRQAIPMVWDYAESNPFCGSSGSYRNMLEWVIRCISLLPASVEAKARQFDAQADIGLRGIMIATDPPYYDNIGYADLSDFFYVWMRQTLQGIYPELFDTILVPKTEELVATPYRFDGDTEKARYHFEKGMSQALKRIHAYSVAEIPVTIYYAFKQDDVKNGQTPVSVGWETMLTAIIEAGFAITGTWPIRTEMVNRPVASRANALASSIVLVCRKRPTDAPLCTRRDFISALRRELGPALDRLQASNIAPVDMAQSAIGPGMAIYSRYSAVVEADGTPMGVRTALQLINQELDLYLTDQDGELDSESRFCVDLFTQYAFNEIKFGQADVLARAKNTSVERLASGRVLYAEKGVVRLLTREEIGKYRDGSLPTIWLLTQQLAYALEKDGVAGVASIVAGFLTSAPAQARALAYRLYTVSERKGWAGEAYAYNSLVIAWPEIQAKAYQFASEHERGEQLGLFDQ